MGAADEASDKPTPSADVFPTVGGARKPNIDPSAFADGTPSVAQVRSTILSSNGLPWDNNSWQVAAEVATVHHRRMVAAAGSFVVSGSDAVLTTTEVDEHKPQLLLQTVVVPEGRTSEGQIVAAVTIPWFDIVRYLQQDPNIAFQIDPRKWEEIVAGSYK